jgi:hypothetical protein
MSEFFVALDLRKGRAGVKFGESATSENGWSVAAS